MFTFFKVLLIGVQVISCFLLVAVILLQKSKGGGGLGGAAFGGGFSDSIFGSRAGNVLTKATIFLAVTFLVNTLVLSGMMIKQQGPPSVMQGQKPRAPSSAIPGLPPGSAGTNPGGDVAPPVAVDPAAAAVPTPVPPGLIPVVVPATASPVVVPVPEVAVPVVPAPVVPVPELPVPADPVPAVPAN